jgi:hypothetical protein
VPGSCHVCPRARTAATRYSRPSSEKTLPTVTGVAGSRSSLVGRVVRPSTIETGTWAPAEIEVQTVATSSVRACVTDRPRRLSMRRIRAGGALSGRFDPRCSRPPIGRVRCEVVERAPSEITCAIRTTRGGSERNGCTRRHSRHRAVPWIGWPAIGVAPPSMRRIRCTVVLPQVSQNNSAAWRPPRAGSGGEVAADADVLGTVPVFRPST